TVAGLPQRVLSTSGSSPPIVPDSVRVPRRLDIAPVFLSPGSREFSADQDERSGNVEPQQQNRQGTRRTITACDGGSRQVDRHSVLRQYQESSRDDRPDRNVSPTDSSIRKHFEDDGYENGNDDPRNKQLHNIGKASADLEWQRVSEPGHDCSKDH